VKFGDDFEYCLQLLSKIIYPHIINKMYFFFEHSSTCRVSASLNYVWDFCIL